jgi:hypothetical protein
MFWLWFATLMGTGKTAQYSEVTWEILDKWPRGSFVEDPYNPGIEGWCES